MKKFTKSLFILLLSLTLINCSSTSSISDKGNIKIPGKNKTYAVNFSSNGDKEINSSDKTLLIKTFENKMKDKGYVKSEKPDIVVMLNLETITKESKPYTRQGTNYDNGQTVNRSSHIQVTGYSAIRYNWNLKADFINTFENKLIYKGKSSKNMGENSSSKSFKERAIRELVYKTLESNTMP